MDVYIKRRYKKCVICGARRLPKSQIFLANFPLDPDRCRLWVKASGDEDLIHVPIEKLHQLKFICGLHFTQDCFNEKGNRLLKHAVPTLALPSPLADDLFTEFPLHVRSYYEKNELDMDASISIIADKPSSTNYIPVASTSTASIPKSGESLPVMADGPTASSIEYIPIASTSKAPMHLTFKRKSDEVSNKDFVLVQSYKRQKSVADKSDVDHEMTKREKKLLKRLEESKVTIKRLSKTSLNLDKLDSETLKTIVNNAIQNQNREPHGKRWDLKNKISALAIFKRSPKAYRYIQN